MFGRQLHWILLDSVCSWKVQTWVTIWEIHIEKIPINARLALTDLPCIWYWLHGLVFGLILFTNIQKEEFSFLFHCTIKKSVKERFICSKHKKQEMKISFVGFIGSVKSILAKASFVFKKWSQFKLLSIQLLSLFEQNVSIVKHLIPLLNIWHEASCKKIK